METTRGMKAKTIKAILSKKFNHFVESIEDDKVKELVKNNTIITGGAIASMLLGEPVNDYDLYFTNQQTTVAVAEYYVNRFKTKTKAGIDCPISVNVDQDGRVSVVVKSSGVASENGTETPYEYFEGRADGTDNGYVAETMSDIGDIQETYEETKEKALENTEDGYRPVFLSTNAITLTNKIQIILRFYGAADELHENYDFVHCTNYWTPKDNNLVLRPAALEALLSKELRYVGSKYPVCSIIRIRKFLKRGWVINAGQILKIVMQISGIDLTDPKVLREQLTGVDSAYFCQILSIMKEKNPDKIDNAYLIEIIDRMF